jgi:hypothetical protein
MVSVAGFLMLCWCVFEGNARGYFQERERLEERIILENDWLSFWQNCSWLDEPLENLTFQIPTY